MSKAKQADISRKMDELLGKPPVSKSGMSNSEFSAKEDELINSRIRMQIRERVLQEKEKNLKYELNELEVQVNGLKKTREKTWNEIEILKKEKNGLSVVLQDILNKVKENRSQIKQAEGINVLLDKKEARFKEREATLVKKEKALAEKEKMLTFLDREISTKESTMNRLSSLINSERESFEKRKNSLLSDLDDLQKQKALLSEEVKALRNEYSIENHRVKQALHDVKELYDAAEKKNKVIDQRAAETENGIERKRGELYGEYDKMRVNAEKEFADRRKSFFRDLEKKQHELIKKEDDLTKFSLTLNQREIELKQWGEELGTQKSKLTIENKEQEMVRKNIVELTSEERLLEQKVADFRDKLRVLESDYISKSNELKMDQKMLDGKEGDIVRRIRQLEDDQRTLEKRKDEFVEEINKLEKDKRLFDSKVEEFSSRLDRVKEVDKEVKQLKAWESELEQKEQKILKNSLFRINVDNLKKEKERIEKEIKRLQPKLSKVTEIDKKLTNRERMLNEKEARVRDLFDELTSERESIVSKGISTYFQNPEQVAELVSKEPEMEATVQLVQEKNPNNFSVLSLIQNARHALVNHNVDDAKEIYSKLNTLYKKIPQNQEKKKLYYEILELKTDIELTSV